MEVAVKNIQRSPGIYDKLIIPRKPVSVSRPQAEFIYSFLKEKGIKKTMEIGFAYGCSAAHIIAATHSRHYVIDPFQKYDWNNLGIKNLKLLKLYKYIKLIPSFSHSALPELLKKRLRFDFIFIDGDHKYDTIMIDFYYADLLLNVGGYVLFDDMNMEASKETVNWIKTNRFDYIQMPLPDQWTDENGEHTNYDMFALFQKIAVDERRWDHFNTFR